MVTQCKPKQLETLYKRRSDGGIQQWTIETRGGKFRVTAGQKGGKLVTNKWTVCVPKNIGKVNETTPEQQAQLETQAKWTKKLAGEYAKLSAVKKGTAFTFIKPMLAKNFKDYEDGLDELLAAGRVYCQPKLDGIRLIMRPNDMRYRTGKPVFAAPHLEEQLEPVLKKHPYLIFDGEMYTDKFSDNFNMICKLAKRTNVTADTLEQSREHLQYWIYDVIDTRYPDMCFSDRNAMLVDLLGKSKFPMSNIILTPTHNPTTREELDELYAQFISDGYEGQIVRIDSPYEHKRTNALLKRKEFTDDEYMIVGGEEGIGGRSGTLGKFFMEGCRGEQFKCNVKGNHTYLAELLVDLDKYLGKMATVRYFNLTPDGIPRFGYVIAIRDYE